MVKNLYNKILEDAILPAGDLFLGYSFMEHLRLWRQIQWLSRRELEELQQSNLEKILTFALNKIPYYRKLGIKPSSNPLETLRKFPVLTKQEIKKNLDNLIVGNKHKLIRATSSGSTGIQGEVFMDYKAISISRAIQTLLWEWAGYKLGKRMLQLGMQSDRTLMKKTKDFLCRTDYTQAFHLNEKDVKTILMKYGKSTDVIFGGYASGLFAYAELAKELEMNDICFASVISWGDKMYPHYRNCIESQFSTRIFDIYGSGEGFVIAGQCEHGSYHIMTPHILLELLDDKNSDVENGTMGRVIVTRLDSFSMPLIRYDLGDLAVCKEDPGSCTCGRHLPLLEQVVGRDTDIIKTGSGKHMVVHFFTSIFEEIPEIRQFRVLQHNSEGITIEYIRGDNFRESILEKIRDTITGHLLEDFKIEFVEVSTIPPTQSGKPQIVKSFLG